MVEAGTEWNAIAPRQPERVQRPQRTLLAAPSVQSQDAFGPWQGWQQSAEHQTYAQPVANQQNPQTVNPQPFVQGVSLTSPILMPAARHGGESVQSAPARSRPPRSTPTERSEPQPQRARKKEPRVRRVDLIHIIDEYPDCIKEEIKRARERLISPSGFSKFKESADADIPRTSIPVGSQRHANPVYHQPQYPQAATQAPAAYEQQHYPLSVNRAQTAHQQQWNGRADQLRYASPYAQPHDRMSRGVNATRRSNPSMHARDRHVRDTC
jgi:hypothetical protein